MTDKKIQKNKGNEKEVASKNNDTARHHTPILRFPNFSDDWEEKKLGEVGVFKSGIGFPHSQQGGKIGIPFFKVSDMNLPGNKLEMIYSNNYVTENQITEQKYKVIKNKSIIFAKVGAAVYLERKRLAENFLIDNNMMSFTCNENIIFIKYFFDKTRLSKYAQAGALPSYNASDMKTIKINLPQLPEQEKIASFLTAVDDWVGNLKEQKAEMENYKKGIMQQIFPAKDQSQPTLRFTYFSDDWEEKKLGEISEITTGKLDANAMKENGKYRFYTCAKDFYQIDKFAFDTEALLISGNGANVGYIHYYNGKFNAYQRTYVLDKFSQNIIYIKFFLDKALKNRIKREKKEGNTPYIVMGTLFDMKINLPQLTEQENIASFLSFLDDIINSTEQKITKVEN